jgi:hypothetical protein
MSIAQGNTLGRVLVKSTTIEGYLHHVLADHITQNTRRLIVNNTPVQDPHHDHQGTCQEIRCILDKVQKWENRPKKPTRSRVKCWIIFAVLIQPRAQLLTSSPGQLVYHGPTYRPLIRKYCQTSTNSNRGRFKTNLYGDPTAFLFQDFRLYRHNREELVLSQALLLHPTSITSISITWRRQKNNQVDADRNLVRNDSTPHRCPVRAALRILWRASHFHVPHHCPLGIYLDHTKASTPRYFNDLQIRQQLRELAVTVHHVSDSTDLAKYTTHSVRVGACVILFLANVPKAIIKFCL